MLVQVKLEMGAGRSPGASKSRKQGVKASTPADNRADFSRHAGADRVFLNGDGLREGQARSQARKWRPGGVVDDFAAAVPWSADEDVLMNCEIDENGRLVRKLGNRGVWRQAGPPCLLTNLHNAARFSGDFHKKTFVPAHCNS